MPISSRLTRATAASSAKSANSTSAPANSTRPTSRPPSRPASRASSRPASRTGSRPPPPPASNKRKTRTYEEDDTPGDASTQDSKKGPERLTRKPPVPTRPIIKPTTATRTRVVTKPPVPPAPTATKKTETTKVPVKPPAPAGSTSRPATTTARPVSRAMASTAASRATRGTAASSARAEPVRRTTRTTNSVVTAPGKAGAPAVKKARTVGPSSVGVRAGSSTNRSGPAAGRPGVRSAGGGADRPGITGRPTATTTVTTKKTGAFADKGEEKENAGQTGLLGRPAKKPGVQPDKNREKSDDGDGGEVTLALRQSPAKRGRLSSHKLEPIDTANGGDSSTIQQLGILMSPAKHAPSPDKPFPPPEQPSQSGIPVPVTVEPLRSPAKRAPDLFAGMAPRVTASRDELDRDAAKTTLLASPAKRPASPAKGLFDGGPTTSSDVTSRDTDSLGILASPAKRPASPVKGMFDENAAETLFGKHKISMLASPAKRLGGSRGFKFASTAFGNLEVPKLTGSREEVIEEREDEDEEPPAETKKPSQMLMAGDDTVSNPFANRGLLFGNAPSLKLPGRRSGGSLADKEDLTGDMFAPVRRSPRNRKPSVASEVEEVVEESMVLSDDLGDDTFDNGLPSHFGMRGGMSQEQDDDARSVDRSGFEPTLDLTWPRPLPRTSTAHLLDDSFDLGSSRADEDGDSVMSDYGEISAAEPTELEITQQLEQVQSPSRSAKPTPRRRSSRNLSPPKPTPRRISPRLHKAKSIGGAFGLRQKDAEPQFDDSEEEVTPRAGRAASVGRSVDGTPSVRRSKRRVSGVARLGEEKKESGFTPLVKRMGEWEPAEGQPR